MTECTITPAQSQETQKALLGYQGIQLDPKNPSETRTAYETVAMRVIDAANTLGGREATLISKAANELLQDAHKPGATAMDMAYAGNRLLKSDGMNGMLDRIKNEKLIGSDSPAGKFSESMSTLSNLGSYVAKANGNEAEFARSPVTQAIGNVIEAVADKTFGVVHRALSPPPPPCK